MAEKFHISQARARAPEAQARENVRQALPGWLRENGGRQMEYFRSAVPGWAGRTGAAASPNEARNLTPNRGAFAPHLPVPVGARLLGGGGRLFRGVWLGRETFGPSGYSKGLLEAGADRGGHRDPDRDPAGGFADGRGVGLHKKDQRQPAGSRWCRAHFFRNLESVGRANGPLDRCRASILGASSVRWAGRPKSRAARFYLHAGGRPRSTCGMEGRRGPICRASPYYWNRNLCRDSRKGLLSPTSSQTTDEERAYRAGSRKGHRSRRGPSAAPHHDPRRCRGIVGRNALPRKKPGQSHPATRQFPGHPHRGER